MAELELTGIWSPIWGVPVKYQERYSLTFCSSVREASWVLPRMPKLAFLRSTVTLNSEERQQVTEPPLTRSRSWGRGRQ